MTRPDSKIEIYAAATSIPLVRVHLDMNGDVLYQLIPELFEILIKWGIRLFFVFALSLSRWLLPARCRRSANTCIHPASANTASANRNSRSGTGADWSTPRICCKSLLPAARCFLRALHEGASSGCICLRQSAACNLDRLLNVLCGPATARNTSPCLSGRDRRPGCKRPAHGPTHGRLIDAV